MFDDKTGEDYNGFMVLQINLSRTTMVENLVGLFIMAYYNEV